MAACLNSILSRKRFGRLHVVSSMGTHHPQYAQTVKAGMGWLPICWAGMVSCAVRRMQVACAVCVLALHLRVDGFAYLVQEHLTIRRGGHLPHLASV